MSQSNDGLKVVDAEPVQQPTQSTSTSLNPNAILNNTLDGFAQLSSRFNPFAQKLNKGIGQVRQVLYTYIIKASIYSLLYSTLKKSWEQLKILLNYLRNIGI